MKKTLLLTFAFLSALAGSAKCVVITLKGGTLMYYQLGGEKNPVMTFPDGQVCMNDDTFEITDIKNFYISNEDDPNALLEVAEKPAHRFVAGTFTAKANEKDEVKVYGIGGNEVKVEVTTEDGLVNINLNKLQRGTYIIKIGKESFKVNKR